MRVFSYRQAVSFLESLPAPARWSLETPKRLNETLGIGLRCQVLHVSGTNGKGSACSFSSEILRRAGYNVGLYTSPHLERYNERIKVNGKDIGDAEFSAAVSETAVAVKKMQKNEGITPSTFEALTAAALRHFQKQGLDFLVLEVGLGGRLDATNAIDAQVALVTNVALEHTRELGGSVAQIAREKAGIIKERTRFAVTGCTQPAALKQIKDASDKNGAGLKVLGKDFSFKVSSVSLDSTVFDYDGLRKYPDLRSPLLGGHQASNASCAIAAIECFQQLGFNIPETAVREGVKRARWPGRLEKMRQNPLVILDGAHNPHGMAALRAAVGDLLPRKKIVFVVGILADKDHRQMVSALAPLASKMVFCRPASERAADPEMLASEAVKAGCKNVAVFPLVSEAVRQAISSSAASEAVVVTGSLYTVGEARAAFRKGL